MNDIRQTKEYAKYMENNGWIVENIEETYCYIKKIPIIGSIIKIQRPQTLPQFEKINLLANKYRAFEIVIEPRIATPHGKPVGFKQSKTPFLPSKTIQIDLIKSEDQLLKEMHYKTRYNIKKCQTSDIRCQISENIDEFARFWDRENLKKGRFIPQNKEITGLYNAFGKNSDLLLAFKENILLGGVMILQTPQIAYYMYAASSDDGKKQHIPTLLAWEAIKLAKEKKAKIFDFEGIYDERFPLPAWIGFTRFKRSFGGKEVEYPGAYIKYLLPFKI